ncbi:MAG TPA: Asp-tRNA(Asn)/Glu-tRNA(Gln) amidotransferase subunit GatA [Candidatus Saccharimonadales bacterium]
MKWSPLKTLASDVGSGRQSATSLVKKALKAIAAGSSYNALISVTAESALRRARTIDQKIKSGKAAGRLAGVPYIAKDNFLTAGLETTAGSQILKGYVPPISSTVTRRLEAEGAILVGKANMDAFAHGSSTENSDFGPTLNPVDKTRVPGGSSGGSAAAVALGLVPFAVGSDTGGSIRLPASFCGVVGLKPTYGLVPRYGVVAMASSTDVMGPLTTSVEDSALILDIIAGPDGKDATVIDREKNYNRPASNLKGLKIGLVKDYFDAGLAPGVDLVVRDAIKRMKAAGATIKEVSIPSVSLALAVYYIVMPAEVSSNLSRYDGIRYGYRAKGSNLDELYKATRSQGFNAENKRRIMVGTYVLSSGYYDAYYKKAQTVRTKLIEEFFEAFSGVDLLVGPTASTTAFKLGTNSQDPLAMYLTDIMTVAANLVGNPAISLPVGLSDGLPVGLQLMAPQRQDAKLLAAAKAVEVL